MNRNRLLQVETSKRALESELEATRRRLEQSEGGREALLSQIGESRVQLTRWFLSSLMTVWGRKSCRV